MTNLNKEQLSQLRLQISDETITYVANELKTSQQSIEAIFNKELEDHADIVLKCTMAEHERQLKQRRLTEKLQKS